MEETAILDIRLIRESPDQVRAAFGRRHDAQAIALLDEIVGLDAARRETQRRADDLRAIARVASNNFGALNATRLRLSSPFNETPDKVIDEFLNTMSAFASSIAPHFMRYRVEHDPDFPEEIARLIIDAASYTQSRSSSENRDQVRNVLEFFSQIRETLRHFSDRVNAAVRETSEIAAALQGKLDYLPNLPHDSVPDGRGEEDNVVVRTWGEPKTFDFHPQPHWDLGPALGIIDFERGVRMSGSRFYALKGPGAKLQRSLIQWMLDLHVNEHGYTEVYPPFIVTQETLYASGQLPKFAENVYHDAEDDLWLIPTAEVPLTSMHRGEILEPDQLPIHYVAYTPSFRREKMSAGRDIRGIKRGHQFDKVEIYRFVEPETSQDALQALLSDAEDVLRRLGLAYRIVELCAGDLGQAAAKTYDIEVWAPGCDEWLEVSSCSTTGDYQARRANIRYRPEPGARPQYVHTLNGSGVALPRLMIALLETYQQPDGSVTIPEVLRPYTGFKRIVE